MTNSGGISIPGIRARDSCPFYVLILFYGFNVGVTCANVNIMLTGLWNIFAKYEHVFSLTRLNIVLLAL